MTGLEVVEERKKGARPSTVKDIEMARLSGIHTNYKLMVPEHREILAIAASRDPNHLLNIEAADDEADDSGERRVRPRSSEHLGHVSEPSRAPFAVAPVQFRPNPSAAAPLMSTAAAMRQSRPVPGQGTLTCLNAPIAAPLQQAASRHQAFFDGVDFSEDDDELMP